MDYSNLSISKIKEIIDETDIENYGALIDDLMMDERKGVLNLAKSLLRKKEKYDTERERLKNIKRYENTLHEEGIEYIAGIDEVGRGPLCGPVVSAAVIMKKDSNLLYVNDSKKLSKQKREELSKEIQKDAIAVGIGVVDNNVIDEINILEAAKLSMIKAVNNLKIKPDMLLIDALSLDLDIPQKDIIKGDENVYSIAAASIVAKVYRDKMMEEYDRLYPNYNLKSNKGYGTYEHCQAIREYGPSPIHRKTFLTSITGITSTDKGRKYEEVVQNFLKKKGYKILENNYSSKYGEIDIIAKYKNIIAFIEVKGRKNERYSSPKEAVTDKKQEKIIKTAKKYLMDTNQTESLCRFDVVEIIDDRGYYKVNHICNAFMVK